MWYLVVGRLMSFTSQPQHAYLQYWIGLKHMRHVVMRIQACSEAYIAFLDRDKVGYEVALGTNSQ